MKQGKVWGSTELIIKTESLEVHRIEVKKGGYCSTHTHKYKHNMFFVEFGLLEIHVFKNDYELEDITLLENQEKTSVRPNEYHYFKALDTTIAYEIYYVEPIGLDIIRKNHGGVK
jgi:mannose-6-phosphate isomerase-like protein (cupin superfamily)